MKRKGGSLMEIETHTEEYSYYSLLNIGFDE
jgi:hypothetical protein